MEQAQPAEQTSVSNELLGAEFWRFIIVAPLLLELADNLAPYQFLPSGDFIDPLGLVQGTGRTAP